MTGSGDDCREALGSGCQPRRKIAGEKTRFGSDTDRMWDGSVSFRSSRSPLGLNIVENRASNPPPNPSKLREVLREVFKVEISKFSSMALAFEYLLKYALNIDNKQNVVIDTSLSEGRKKRHNNA